MKRNVFLPNLYPIVNLTNIKESLQLLDYLIKGGAEIVQIRAKINHAEKRYHTTKTVFDFCRSQAIEVNHHSLKIIINDWPELCKELGADGVHLGQEDADPKVTRQLLGEDAIIGLSTHSLTQLKLAPKEVDYCGFGPVFKSTTKSGHYPETGVDILQKVTQISRHPIVAIGGINSRNIALLHQNGIKSVAIIQDLAVAFNNGTPFQKLARRYCPAEIA